MQDQALAHSDKGSVLVFRVTEEFRDMSLIMAVTNGEEIVVASDSKVYEGSGETYRTYEKSKLRIVGDGRWIIGFTGLGDTANAVWDYLEAKGQNFNADIRVGVLECLKEMGQIYTQFRLPPEAKALLAGFSSESPRIYTWKIGQPSPSGGEMPPWAAIGCGADVALHFPQTCQPLETLSRAQLRSLAYFSVSQIADTDLRVGKPIDLAVITRGDGAKLEARESFTDSLEDKAVRLKRAFRENI